MRLYREMWGAYIREPTLRKGLKCLEEREQEIEIGRPLYFRSITLFVVLYVLDVQVSKKAHCAVENCTKNADNHGKFSIWD